MRKGSEGYYGLTWMRLAHNTGIVVLFKCQNQQGGQHHHREQKGRIRRARTRPTRQRRLSRSNRHSAVLSLARWFLDGDFYILAKRI